MTTLQPQTIEGRNTSINHPSYIHVPTFWNLFYPTSHSPNKAKEDPSGPLASLLTYIHGVYCKSPARPEVDRTTFLPDHKEKVSVLVLGPDTGRSFFKTRGLVGCNTFFFHFLFSLFCLFFSFPGNRLQDEVWKLQDYCVVFVSAVEKGIGVSTTRAIVIQGIEPGNSLHVACL